MHHDTIYRFKRAVAEAIILMERDIKKLILDSLSQSNLQRLQAPELCMYDETPMEVCRKDFIEQQKKVVVGIGSTTSQETQFASTSVSREALAVASSSSSSSVTAWIPFMPLRLMTSGKHKQMSKLLQSSSKWSLMLKSPGNEHFLVRGSDVS